MFLLSALLVILNLLLCVLPMARIPQQGAAFIIIIAAGFPRVAGAAVWFVIAIAAVSRFYQEEQTDKQRLKCCFCKRNNWDLMGLSLLKLESSRPLLWRLLEIRSIGAGNLRGKDPLPPPGSTCRTKRPPRRCRLIKNPRSLHRCKIKIWDRQDLVLTLKQIFIVCALRKILWEWCICR